MKDSTSARMGKDTAAKGPYLINQLQIRRTCFSTGAGIWKDFPQEASIYTQTRILKGYAVRDLNRKDTEGYTLSGKGILLTEDLRWNHLIFFISSVSTLK